MDSGPTLSLEHVGGRTYIGGKIKSFISDKHVVLDVAMEPSGVNDQVETWSLRLGWDCKVDLKSRSIQVKTAMLLPKKEIPTEL